MTPRRAAVTSVAAVVGGVGLLLVVALWASSIGPDRVLHGPGLKRVTPKAQTTSESVSASASASPQQGAEPPQQTTTDHPFLRTMAYLVELAILLLVLWLLWRLAVRARQAWRDRIRAPERPEHVEFDVLDHLEDAREQVGSDVDDAMYLLLDGEPRNGIVAAWDRFEQTAATLHLQRRPWETSSEFVIRMLDVVSADSPSVVELERLYREARYSTHPMGEEHRAEAEQALRRIQASLGRVRGRR